ncbi:hypothetical protein [Youngiibacter fragilis]|uniref:Glycosyltransferase RgtA/B/C/D-like domain-containing protein n=1 Tax=Youngiibacter fragilis 232.1 TaxID=994573 RepID=V7I6G2_9CLOT|nr:hypothetical protein [Youngiibacter fragilis]ETA81805.1 hypothetical protein T472_0204460 [Youngiibacter fragilis 232.1]
MEKLKRILPITALFAYFIANLMTILEFPTVHSDELWLKGITDEMVGRKSFAVTEPFFDLYPRVVHPFRWLYHSLEALVFNVLGSSAASARILSLVASVLALIVFYKILTHVLENSSLSSTGSLLPFTGTLALALNIQFLYSSRFGRQDSMILLLLLTAYGIASGYILKGRRVSLVLSLITLLGIGVHPNSFLIGMTTSAVLFIRLTMKEIRLKGLVSYVMITGAGFIGYIAIGNLMNPGFLSGYLKFGESLGIESNPIGRIDGFYWFWYKLYARIGGTYDLLDIRLEIILLGAAILLIPVYVLASRKKDGSNYHSLLTPWSALIGINLGLLVIGRYNQTSVVFLVPFIILTPFTAAGIVLGNIGKRNLTWAFALILLVFVPIRLYSGLDDYREARPYKLGYEDMIEVVEGMANDRDIVLGNLNTIDAFKSQRFYDIRNLAFLEDNGITIGDYIKDRGITLILIHEEMEYIKNTSPAWDFLYGSNYMDDLFRYISENTELIGEFENPIYAMRISRYSGTYPWRTRIYRVRP